MSGAAKPVTVDPEFAQLRRLTEISRALTYTTSLDQVTRLTVERGAELLEASAAVLMLADRDGSLHVRAAHGIAEDRIARFRSPLTDEVFGRLQGLLAVPDDCFIAVPLVVGGAVTGILAVATREPSTAADESMLSSLGDQAAMALENARLGGEVRVEMEGRLRASEGATTAQDKALATLAHDIRTPLGAIDGYCELLADGIYGPLTDPQREKLGRIRMSGRHLLSLLDNVMEMTRLSAGVVRMHLEDVDLGHVAAESVHLLVPATDAKFQTLRIINAAQVTVRADRARLRQVLVNLINNASKFTPADGAITVSTHLRSGQEGGWAEIRVKDTGPGIPDAERDSIFEPYYRSEATAGEPGIGLGLAISSGLMKAMGGELTVESEVGVGSTFILRLPTATA